MVPGNGHHASMSSSLCLGTVVAKLTTLVPALAHSPSTFPGTSITAVTTSVWKRTVTGQGSFSRTGSAILCAKLL